MTPLTVHGPNGAPHQPAHFKPLCPCTNLPQLPYPLTSPIPTPSLPYTCPAVRRSCPWRCLACPWWQATPSTRSCPPTCATPPASTHWRGCCCGCRPRSSREAPGTPSAAGRLLAPPPLLLPHRSSSSRGKAVTAAGGAACQERRRRRRRRVVVVVGLCLACGGGPRPPWTLRRTWSPPRGRRTPRRWRSGWVQGRVTGLPPYRHTTCSAHTAVTHVPTLALGGLRRVLGVRRMRRRARCLVPSCRTLCRRIDVV